MRFAIVIFLWLSVISAALLILAITTFIDDIKPFNAKAMHKRNLKIVKNLRKYNIKNERSDIKTGILNNTDYCYTRIIYKENIDWLKKKGFKVEPDTSSSEKHFYGISWKDC